MAYLIIIDTMEVQRKMEENNQTINQQSLRQVSENYEPQTILNVAELDEVPLDVMINVEKKTNEDGEVYLQKFFIYNDKKYRVPNPVFEEIQKILKLRPDAKKVKVVKTGEGLKSRYKVDFIDPTKKTN